MAAQERLKEVFGQFVGQEFPITLTPTEKGAHIQLTDREHPTLQGILQAAYEHGLGVQVTLKPWGVGYNFCDPDDNKVHFMLDVGDDDKWRVIDEITYRPA
ncbi:MAG: hypothetical protein GC136_03205 [Alphaproteobacteria bacterium]|nr:hypothetical protein [Alphaproteobacteria bacterium]